jgi:hypothetical protein
LACPNSLFPAPEKCLKIIQKTVIWTPTDWRVCAGALIVKVFSAVKKSIFAIQFQFYQSRIDGKVSRHGCFMNCEDAVTLITWMQEVGLKPIDSCNHLF